MSEMDQSHAEQPEAAHTAGHSSAGAGAQQQDEYDEVLAFAADIESAETEG